jgi:glycosyltransferase involved in cell wall biosynthesis
MTTTIGISLHKKPYNYVKKCVESALKQSTPVKVILRTDGEDSCDERTLDYLKKVNSIVPNFTLIEGEENLGIYGSYKKIFEIADTDNICQLDADDYLHQDAIRICEGVLDVHQDYLMVYTDCMEVDENDSEIKLCDRQVTPYTRENIRYKFMTYHLRVIRKSVYDQIGGFDENLKYGGDYDLCLRISEVGAEDNIGYVPLPLYYYRRDNNCHSLSSGIINTQRDCYTTLQKSILRRNESDTLKVISNQKYDYIIFLYKVSEELYKKVDFTKSQPVILTGMHRSFTSLTSSLLTEVGINMGKSILPPDIHNPEGYFENEDFLHFDRGICSVSINSENSFPDWGWAVDERMNPDKLKEAEECAKKLVYDRRKLRLWGWKDPRISLMLDFWDSIIPHAKYVFVYRNPAEVYESVYKLKGIELFQKNPEYIEKCWRDHNKNILNFALKNRERCVIVNTNKLTQNPNALKPLLTEKLKLQICDENLENLVVKKHIRSKGENVNLSEETLQLYEELEKLNDLM